MSWFHSAHEKPMLTAVSTLSPVSIQTLMPAARMKAIVSGTSSCSLSSIAVHPMSSSPLSISSWQRAMSSARPSIATVAS